MVLQLTAPQCFFIVILTFAVIGFQRGWRRELVSLGFTLGAVILLYLGGGAAVAHFIFITVPSIGQVITGTTASAHTGQNAATVQATTVLITAIITFAIVIGAGYLIGNRAFSATPTTPQDRLLGMLPAIISGYFLMLYISSIFKAPLITIGVN